MAPFRKVAEQDVYVGNLIRVTATGFEGPDGSRFDRDVVHHPGAVVVVPLTDDGKVIMVRQYRAAIEGELLEVPAGKRDVEGEGTAVTARRELAEEVGKAAGRIELMARFYNSPGFADEFTYLYLARDLTDVPLDRQSVEEQVMTIEEIPLSEVVGLIRDGQIVDAKSIIGLLMALAGRT